MPIIGDEDVDKDPDVDVDDTIDEDPDVDVDDTIDEDPDVDVDDTIDEDPDVDVDDTIDEDSDVDVDGTIDEDPDVDVDDTIDEDSDVDVDGTIDEDSDVDVDGTIDEDSDVDVDDTIDEDPDVGLNADAIADAQLDIDALVEQGFTRDEAIAAVADQLGTTATELTTAIGTVETAVGLNADAIADAQLDIDALIEQGFTRDEAIAAVADQLGTTATELTVADQLGTTATELITAIGTVETAVGLNADAIADAQLDIDALVEQGFTRDEAIAAVADQLGTTATELTTAIGTVETAVGLNADAIADAQLDIDALIEQGFTRDEAIAAVADQLGTTATELTTAIGTVETAVGLNADAIADAQLDIDALVEQGFTRDEAIAAVADQLGTTATELTTAIGTVETAVGLNADAIADAQLDIDALVEQGFTRDEAIAAVADQLGTTATELTTAIGTVETAVGLNADAIADAQLDIDALVEQGFTRDEAIAAVADQLGTTATELTTAIGTVETAVGLNADAIADAQLDIDALIEQGFTRDEAIAAVADQLGTTATELTTAIGTVETAVGLNADAIADAQLDIDGLVESGVARDTAIATIAEDLGTTEANLTALLEANAAGLDLNAQAIADAQLGIDALVEQGSSTQDAVAEIAEQLGTTAQALATAIGGIDTAVVGVSSEVQALSELIGKPASAITDADIDFYADYLAQQEVLSEAEQASFVPTDQQLQYDVNNDGVIDIADQTLATQSFQGQDVDLAGKFAATGLYAGQQALDARLQDQLDSQLEFEQQQALEREQELERKQALEVQQQIAASASVEAANQEKYEEGFRQLAASNARGTIKTNKMGLAEFGPQYDFKSIFADQKDASMAMTPYGANQQGFFGAKAGGRVESDTDKLIRLIGEQ